MGNRTNWQPSQAEIERMVAEMRPLIAELARQARQSCQGRGPAKTISNPDGDRRYDRLSRSC